MRIQATFKKKGWGNLNVAGQMGKSVLETVCAYANEPGLGGGYIGAIDNASYKEINRTDTLGASNHLRRLRDDLISLLPNALVKKLSAQKKKPRKEITRGIILQICSQQAFSAAELTHGKEDSGK